MIDWKVGFNRTNLESLSNDPAPGWPAFLAANPIQGTPVRNAKYPMFPMLQMPGSTYTTPYQETFPFLNNQLQVMGSISKIKGKHTIKAGMEFLNFRGYLDSNYASEFFMYSLQTADPQNVANTGSVLASDLLGLPGGGSRVLGPTANYMRQVRYQPYVQDDIKITRKLTMNFGLRYEYDQWPVSRWNQLADFDPETPPYGAYLWTKYNPINNEPANARRSIRDPDFLDIAPRIGLAYQIGPQTTFRGGYGIFYTSNELWEGQSVTGNWPNALGQTYGGNNPPTTLPADLSPTTTFWPAYDLPLPGSPPSAFWTMGRKDRTPRAAQGNVGIQHMLSASLLFEVDFVASHTTKSTMYGSVNNALPGPGTVGTPAHPRTYTATSGAMYDVINAASADYSGLQVKVEKRFSNGLQFLSSYAYAHYLDEGGSGFANSAPPQDPNNWAAEKANGLFDLRQIWTFSYFYELPFGQGKKFLSSAHGPLNQIVKGWELTGIIHYNTGAPINVGYPADLANIGAAEVAERPNWVGGFPHRVLNPSDRRLGWINMANYATPAEYTFGTAGRDLERGSGAGYFNPGFLKDFPLHGEGKVLEFRFEFFNVLNQHAMTSFSSSYGASDFGTAYGTQQTSREIQLGMKFLF